MRIALDVRYRTTSGSGMYIEHLVPRMLAVSGQHEFLLVSYPGQSVAAQGPASRIVCPSSAPLLSALWDQTVLPMRLKEHGVDIYHGLKLLGPFVSGCPQIRSAHSITTQYKGNFPTTRMRAAYWNVLGTHLFRRSAHIVAVSRFVADFLVEALGVDPSKVVVIPNGVDPRFRRLQEPELPAAVPPGLHDRAFLLAVGNVVPVKNHLTAVLAFRKVVEHFPELHLLICGRADHPYSARVKATVAQTGLTDRVHFLGFVDSDALVALYNRATLLLLPSLTEGFALAMLEAMACGTPVIAAATGASSEVGSNAVALVNDPMDVEAWAATMERLLGSPSRLQWMSRAGQVHARQFTWDATARALLALYDRVRSSSPDPRTSTTRDHAGEHLLRLWP
jgi:glycosyltransferase involved in cell wall biosynthesis